MTGNIAHKKVPLIKFTAGFGEQIASLRCMPENMMSHFCSRNKLDVLPLKAVDTILVIVKD